MHCARRDFVPKGWRIRPCRGDLDPGPGSAGNSAHGGTNRVEHQSPRSVAGKCCAPVVSAGAPGRPRSYLAIDRACAEGSFQEKSSLRSERAVDLDGRKIPAPK